MHSWGIMKPQEPKTGFMSMTKVLQIVVLNFLFMVAIRKWQKGLESPSPYLNSPKIQNLVKVYWFANKLPCSPSCEEVLALEATTLGNPAWCPWPWKTLALSRCSYLCDAVETLALGQKGAAQGHLTVCRITGGPTLYRESCKCVLHHTDVQGRKCP